MAITLEATTDPTPQDRDVIAKAINAHNTSKAGDLGAVALVIRLRDSNGEVVGGLAGWSYYDWLSIDGLFVPEHLRGQGLGTEILRRAEAIATERGCIGIKLDTFEFQAPRFYEKLGYSVFGAIEDHPRGQSRYYMQKRLDR